MLGAYAPDALSLVQERLALSLGGVIFYALLALLALTAIPYGTVEPWWEAITQVSIFLLAAASMAERLLRQSWDFPSKPLVIPLLAFIAFAFMQTVPLGVPGGRAVSLDPYGTRLALFKLLAIATAGGLLFRYTDSRGRLWKLIVVILGIAVASALFGIMRQTTQREEGFFLPLLAPHSGYGQFINRNHFAFLMEMALGLTLGLIFGGVRRERLLIYVAVSVPLWTALVLTNSRGGILSLMAEALFIAALLLTTQRGQRQLGNEAIQVWLARLGGPLVVKVVLMAGLLSVLALGVLWMGGDPLAERLEAISDEVVTPSEVGAYGAGRLQVWRTSWQIIKEHPMLGVGLGSFWVAVSAHDPGNGRVRAYEAHNDYLELVASVGFLGTAAFAWFVVAFIVRARTRLRSPDDFRRAACVGALTGLFGVAVHSFFDFGLHITSNALIFAALIAIATADIPFRKAADGRAGGAARLGYSD